MKNNMGIWIDHKKAWIISLTPADGPGDAPVAELTEILSDVERRVRLSGGSRTRHTPYGPQDVAVEQKPELRFKHQLTQFYHQVIEHFATAHKVIIMGPGEAKRELDKECQRSATHLAEKIVAVETCDKMTPNQAIARVRAFFTGD